MARKCFEVKKIEFEFTEKNQQIRLDFLDCLNKYASKAVSEITVECKKNKIIFKFKNSISLNTISNTLSLFKANTSIKIKEIEYKPGDKKVEVEVK